MTIPVKDYRFSIEPPSASSSRHDRQTERDERTTGDRERHRERPEKKGRTLDARGSVDEDDPVDVGESGDDDADRQPDRGVSPDVKGE